jgi:subtilisin family serine protease
LKSTRLISWTLLGSVVTMVLLFSAADVARTHPTAEYSPAFRLRTPDPGVTAQTLEWVAEQEATPKIWVYFTDKQVFDSEQCARRLEEIRSSLDEHAAARRAKQMGDGLVDFHDIPVAEEYMSAIRHLGAGILRESRWLNAASIRAPLEALRAIAALPYVQKLTPVRSHRVERPTVAPTPPPPARAKGPRDLFDYGPSHGQLNEIGVIDAHNVGYSGAGVIVAMLDTGFKYDHPAFQQIVNEGRILAQWDFVFDDGEVMDEPEDVPAQHDHGSATWSACGGFYEGELIGPAYGSDYILAKTEDVDNESIVEEDNWVAAAEWVDQLGGDIISSSLAYHRWYTVEDMDGDTAPVTIGADIAASRGIVVCNSAGNMGDQDWYIITAPADGDSVIAVGAVDQYNELAGFSSHGPTADGRTKPEVVARGLGVVCACNFSHDPLEDEFATDSGTSLSCPLVAGAAALVIEARPTWSGMTVRGALMMTADNADNPDNDRGWGRINVMDAIAYPVEVTALEPPMPTPGFTTMPNPTRGTTQFLLELPTWMRSQEPLRLDIFDISGRRVWGQALSSDATVIEWNAEDVHEVTVVPGVYLARLTAGQWRTTNKVTVEP